MAKEEKEVVMEASENVENSGELTDEQTQSIQAKIKEIKAKKNLKRVFAIVVQGDEEDEKPLYVGYFQNPTIPHFSAYMTLVTKDAVAAAMTLAKATFIEGDREIVDDDDIFLRGTFDRLSAIMERRHSNLVKA